MFTLRKINAAVMWVVSLLPALMLVGAGCILTAAETRNAFPNSDVLIYAIIAKVWNYGVIPYRDIADHKPPIVYLFLRICFLLGGSEPIALWRGFTVLTAAGGAALFLGFRSIRFTSLGLATALAYVFFFWQNPLRLPEPAFLNTEHLATLFLALAYASLLVFTGTSKLLWGILAGFLFSLSVFSKQPAAIFIFPFVVHLLLYPWSDGRFRLQSVIRRLGFVAMGSVVPIAIITAYFFFHDALADLWKWNVTANLAYAPITRTSLPFLKSVWSENTARLIVYLSADSALAYRVSLYTIPLLLVWRRSWIDVVALSWLLSGVGALMLNLQSGHGHYFWFVQMPLSVSLGVGICGVANLLSRLINRLIFVPRLEVALSLSLCALVYFSDCQWFCQRAYKFVTAPREGLQSGNMTELLAVSRKINPSDRDSVYLMFFGPDPSIFFYGNFKPASRYIYPMAPAMSNGFKDDLASSAIRLNPPFAYLSYLLNPQNLPTEGEGFPADLGRLLMEKYTFWFQGAAGYIYRRNDVPVP